MRERERAAKALEVLTRPRALDYLALYPATVLQDHGDMHLDLRPDDERLPPLVRVPLRVFLPGCYVKVKAGSRVLLGFEGANPERPVAYLWEAGSTEVVEIRTARGARVRIDDGAGKTRVEDPTRVEVEAPVIRLGGDIPIARVGDSVSAGVIVSGSSKVFAG